MPTAFDTGFAYVISEQQSVGKSDELSYQIAKPLSLLPTLQRDCETSRKNIYCIDFDTVDYETTRDIQVELVAARKKRSLDRDAVLILEHFPVFTLGRRGGRENLTVTPEFLEKSGVKVLQAERGGNITYHGPGQLVVYFIVDLFAARIKVVDFVEKLEKIMIRTAGEWGIHAEQNKLNRGVWVGNAKLGSVGIAVRRGVSFHGLALNVNPSMEPFGWINPCGLHGIRMTSMKRELSEDIPMHRVRESVKSGIESIFCVNLKPATPEKLGFEKP